MADNIFTGLNVVDFSSFIAGPATAVILSDFGADVIKVEPPTGDTFESSTRFPRIPRPRTTTVFTWITATSAAWPSI